MTQTQTTQAQGAQELTLRVKIEKEDKGIREQTLFKNDDGGILAVLWQSAKMGYWIYSAIGKYPSQEIALSYQHGIECASDSIRNYYKRHGINVEFIKE